MWYTYIIIAVLLIVAELVYFRIADKCNIIDKPNERSSHSKVVIRGGGIIFVVGLWIWSAFFGFKYPWLLAAVTLAAGVSFWDDVRSLPDGVRLVVQFVAMGLLFLQIVKTLGFENSEFPWWLWALFGIVSLVVCVGATNIYNFMDGINGITVGYSLAVLLPLLLTYRSFASFIMLDVSLIIVVILSVLVFAFFNFRPKNKAKCFAGDVGSVGMAFILLFLIGCLVMKLMDITWLILLLVYGVDGCCTIVHRIMLHENLGEAHRKHAYQIMANELGMSHIIVSLIYTTLQLAISLGFIYLCRFDDRVAHWIYLICAGALLVAAYVIFMKKYYHLHEEYLAGLKK